METRAPYVAVGTFVLVMIVVGFVAVMWIARSSLNTQYASYDIYFRKTPVTGLREGAPVEYNGVPVGRVADIKIVPFRANAAAEEDELGAKMPDEETPATMIRVTIEIDDSVEIKKDAGASVETNLLSGVSYILIVKGTQAAPVLRAEAGERYPVINARRSRLASVVARAPELLDKADKALEAANKLLDEKNRQAIAESLDNIRNFTKGLAERNQDIAELTGNAKKATASLANLADNLDKSYSGPDGIGNKLSTTISDIDKFTKNLTDTNHQLQAALQDVRPGLKSFSTQTLPNVGILVGEARQLVTGLGRLSGELERDPSRILFGDRREGYRPK